MSKAVSARARRNFLGAATLGVVAVNTACTSSGSNRAKVAELPALGGNQIRTAWSTALSGGGFNFSPAVASDFVWAAARDGTVAKIAVATGQVQWRKQLDKALTSGAGSDGEVMVVATRDGNLLGLDQSGERKWQVSTGVELAAVPTVGAGVVVIRATDNKIFAFDADSGKRRWVVTRQASPIVVRQTAGFAIDGASAFVGLPGGRLAAYSVQNGAVRWETAVSNPRGATDIERIADVLGTPLVSGREVCAASYQGRVGCFELSSGRPFWTREWAASGGIELGTRHVFASDVRGRVTCLERTNGNPVWTQEGLLNRELTGPVALGNVVLVGDHLGQIHALDASEGKIVGRLATDGSRIVSAGVQAGSAAVFQTTAGAVVAVSLAG